MEKERLRKRLIQHRQSLPASEVRQKSQLICERVFSLVDWSKVGSLHVYKPVPSWGEIETSRLITKVNQAHPGIKVTIPRLNKSAPIPRQKFDVIIVPVLGFDLSNHRLGLGGGWYDRFLAAQPQAKKIGLAYSWALFPEGLPAEQHDIMLDLIITG